MKPFTYPIATLGPLCAAREDDSAVWRVHPSDPKDYSKLEACMRSILESEDYWQFAWDHETASVVIQHWDDIPSTLARLVTLFERFTPPADYDTTYPDSDY